jgi:hypothetical protein
MTLMDIVVLQNGMEAIRANYLPQEVKNYQDNPLIEALPPILEVKEAFRLLSVTPSYDEEERLLPSHIRFHLVLNLEDVFVPMNNALQLEQRFSRLIRKGYVGRNPNSKKHVQFLKEMHKCLVNKSNFTVSSDNRSKASSISILGLPGTGKTTTMDRILDCYPQVIVHSYPIGITQVVWLKLNCPHDGSLRTLCLNFFIKLDELLGTSYFKSYKRSNISTMVIQMAHTTRVHGIGVIFLDEVQNLLAGSGEAKEEMLNFLVTLINEIGIPLLFIGNMKAKALLQKDLRQGRRSSGQGDMMWLQLKNDVNWEIIMTAIWRYQWTKEYIPLSKEFIDVFYNESQGIPDLAVKLYMLTQSHLISKGIESFTPTLIPKISKEYLSNIQPFINALKSGDKKKLLQYQDLVYFDVEKVMQKQMPIMNMTTVLQQQKELLEENNKKEKYSFLGNVITTLLKIGINEKIADSAARYVINNMPGINLKVAIQEALSHIDNMEKDKKKTDQPIKMNTLNLIVNNGKKQKNSAYESLRKAGYIKNPLDDLKM